MEPGGDRRRRVARPGPGAWRLLVPIVVLVVLGLGVVAGLAATRGGEQPAAASSTPAPPTSSLPAPTTKATRPKAISTPSTGPTTHTSRSSSSTREPPPSTTRSSTPILQQRRPLPNGVLAQMLSTTGGADGSACDSPQLDVTRLREPTIAIGTDRRPNFAVVEIAQPIQLCLQRFEPDRPIEVTVRSPDGRVTAVGDPPCWIKPCPSHVNWAAVPGDPAGNYQVTAVQGQLRAVATVRVVPARTRHILVVGNGVDEQQYQSFRRGQTIPVAIAGYGPDRDVQLFIYHTRERLLQRSTGELRFRTWIQLHTDPRGETMYRLQTAPGDPPGCYALDTRPETQTELRWVETVQGQTFVNNKATEPLFCLT
jgi:hypothetical protein